MKRMVKHIVIFLSMLISIIFLVRDIYLLCTGGGIITTYFPITSYTLISFEIVFSLIVLILGPVYMLFISKSEMENLQKKNGKERLIFYSIMILFSVAFVFHITRLILYLIFR